MYLGQVVEVAPVGRRCSRDPLHPYTRRAALRGAGARRGRGARRRRIILKGDIPTPPHPPAGCRFHTRCWLYEHLGRPEICATSGPALAEAAERPTMSPPATSPRRCPRPCAPSWRPARPPGRGSMRWRSRRPPLPRAWRPQRQQRQLRPSVRTPGRRRSSPVRRSLGPALDVPAMDVPLVPGLPSPEERTVVDAVADEGGPDAARSGD